jgi:dUTP pyrophosphatase
MNIGILNKSRHGLPTYRHDGDSGMDVRADIGEPTILPAGERCVIPTGLYFQIPRGYEFQVRPRSGMAANHGITVLNTPGTIDSNYTGELKIILYNSSKIDYQIEPGDRIAQIVLVKTEEIQWTEISELDQTSRGAGGFGSTGIK